MYYTSTTKWQGTATLPRNSRVDRDILGAGTKRRWDLHQCGVVGHNLVNMREMALSITATINLSNSLHTVCRDTTIPILTVALMLRNSDCRMSTPGPDVQLEDFLVPCCIRSLIERGDGSWWTFESLSSQGRRDYNFAASGTCKLRCHQTDNPSARRGQAHSNLLNRQRQLSPFHNHEA